MQLLQPFGLILLPPLIVVWIKWRRPDPWLSVFRLLVFSLLIVALCRPVINLPIRAGVVVAVADRSRSMPPQSAAAQTEAIQMIAQARPSQNLLGVVAFGRQAVVEHPPDQSAFGGFVNVVDDNQSNLADALDMALTLIPAESSGRILVLSDGQYTGAAPNQAAARAAARNIAVDHRLYRRPRADDVAIIDLAAPETVQAGSAFYLKAQVSAPSEQTLEYVLLRGDTTIAAGKKTAPPGKTTFWFRDHAPTPGVLPYRLRISGENDDPVPENNLARLLVDVSGTRPLLLATEQTPSGLEDLLSKSGLDIQAVTPSQTNWSLESLSAHRALIIEDISADRIGQQGMQNIAAYVQNSGAGVMFTGGKHAFGPGGYFRSPLAPLIPVSMEIKKEHRKQAVAIVVALDRSGSMAMRVSEGRTKMDLANLGAVQVPDLMSPFDEFGVIAVDSVVHIIIELVKLENAGDYEDKILRIQSGGGGVFVYSALTAAAAMLHKAEAQTRHIILFADAADAEQPGKYRELLVQCQKAQISVSVIGLGGPDDRDAEFLRDVVERGGGRLYFTDHPTEIPRLFIQDTFTVMRNAFIEEPTNAQFTAAWGRVASTSLADFPTIGGYNLCYLKPDANQALITTDENQAPLAAFWRTGSGRSLAYMGEADGPFTGELAHYENAGAFFTSLASWTAGSQNPLPDDMLITQKQAKGNLKVVLELDPERSDKRLGLAPEVMILRSRTGEKPQTASYPMRWVAPDRLAADIPLNTHETVLPIVKIKGWRPIQLAPTCLPYSPEFKPTPKDFGAQTLQTLARATGGRARADLAGVWDDLPVKKQSIEISQWLLITALGLFLLEILHRRTGLLTRRRQVQRKPSPKKEKRLKRRTDAEKTAQKPHVNETIEPDGEASKKDDALSDTLDALRQATHRANQRLGRK